MHVHKLVRTSAREANKTEEDSKARALREEEAAKKADREFTFDLLYISHDLFGSYSLNSTFHI